MKKIALVLVVGLSLCATQALASIPGSNELLWDFTGIGTPDSGQIVAVTADSTQFSGPAENLVNGSGREGDHLGLTQNISGFWQNNPDLGTHAANPAGAGGNSWVEVEFDQAYQLDKLWIWNHNQGAPTWGPGTGCLALPCYSWMRSYKDIDIHVSADGVTYSQIGGTTQLSPGAGANGFVHNWDGTTQDPGVGAPGNNEFSLGGASAKFLVITAHSSWGEARYGLSDLRISEIPEPATMALLGLGGLLVSRKRKA